MSDRDYAVLGTELAMALDLLGKCQECASLPDELHDDIAAAATHWGWWQSNGH